MHFIDDNASGKIGRYHSVYCVCMPNEVKNNNPDRTARWVIYGVSKELKNEVKIYALKKEITIGQALEEIINLWLALEKDEK